MRLFKFFLSVFIALKKRFWFAVGGSYLRTHGVIGARGVRIYGFPIISVSPGSLVEIGKNVVLCSDSRFTALGVSRKTVIRALSPVAKIKIGSEVGISGGVICAVNSIEIGDFCLIGSDVQIVDTDFHPVLAENRRYESILSEKTKSKRVLIERNVFLGAGVKVMKGVVIGENSVIGAGSIVTQDIPRDSIAVGVPARVVGRIPQ